VELTATKIPVSRPHVMAIGTTLHQESVIVKVYTDEDLIGLGEVPHMVGTSGLGESQHTVMTVLERHIVPRIIDMDPTCIEAVHEAMRKAIPWNLRAKSGIDLAIHDILGKHVKTPVYNLLGGKYRDKVLLSSSLPITEYDKALKEAEEKISKGYRVLKQKIGFDADHDIEMVKRLRDQFGYDLKLRADANQGYSVKTAIRTIKKMDRYGLDFLEQPVVQWDFRGMAEVSKAVETPIMADEPVVTIKDVLGIIEERAAQHLSIYICKPGGLLNAKKIATVAETQDMQCYVGGALEGPSGTAAGLHFAASTPNISLGCEVGGQFLLLTDVAKEPIAFKDGYLEVPNKPGLGIELDWDKVNECKIGSLTIPKDYKPSHR